jgi:hypothetical protein
MSNNWSLVKVTPTNGTVSIVSKHPSKEYLLHLLALLNQRDEIEIKIGMLNGEISQETGENLLENTFYKIRKI